MTTPHHALAAAPRAPMEVAVGVLEDDAGRRLVQERAKTWPAPGRWEHPGGKIDPGETPEQALARELEEELGVRATRWSKLTVIDGLTGEDGRSVRLHVFVVRAWNGAPRGTAGQRLRWITDADLDGLATLAGVAPIRAALRARRPATGASPATPPPPPRK